MHLFLAGAVAGVMCFWLGFATAAIFKSAHESDHYIDEFEREVALKYGKREEDDRDNN